MIKKQKPIDIHTTGYYEGQLSDDVSESLKYVINSAISYCPNDLTYKHTNKLEQHIQSQASEIERLKGLNKGKADEYFKLLEMYNLSEAKLYAIREVIEEKLNRLDGIIADLESKLQSDAINTYWVEQQLKYWNTVAEDYHKINKLLGDE